MRTPAPDVPAEAWDFQQRLGALLLSGTAAGPVLVARAGASTQERMFLSLPGKTLTPDMLVELEKVLTQQQVRTDVREAVVSHMVQKFFDPLYPGE